MKHFLCLILFGAVLIHAQEQTEQAEQHAAAASEIQDNEAAAAEEYMARVRKSATASAYLKPKSWGAPAYPAPAAPAYAPPAAPAYAPPAYSAPAYPAPALTYSAPAPAIPCSRAIVVGCAPTVQAAPCSAPPASYAASAY